MSEGNEPTAPNLVLLGVNRISTLHSSSKCGSGHNTSRTLIKEMGKPKRPYFVSFENNLIPTTDELNNLTAIEQVLTAGFPGQLWDDVHDLPVFHRGYTATAPYINFKGKDEFLIDIATWPGASGSPVMLFNQGSYALREGGLAIGSRFKLLGVVYGVAVQDVHGAVLFRTLQHELLFQGQ